MKTLKYLLLLFVCMTIGIQLAKTFTKVPRAELPDRRSVIACHAAIRCPTCISMERQTKAFLERAFPKSGLQFRILNYQAPENAAIAERYKIATATILLVDKTGGQERVENLAADVWTFVGDEDAFAAMLQENISRFLSGQPLKSSNQPEEGTPVNQPLNNQPLNWE